MIDVFIFSIGMRNWSIPRIWIMSYRELEVAQVDAQFFGNKTLFLLK